MFRAAWSIGVIGGVAAVAAAAAAAAEGARVEASVAESADGATITLKKAGEAQLPRASAQLAGGVLVVRFADPVEGDVSGLASSAPRTIAAARRDADGRSFRISLRRTLKADLAQTDAAATVTLSPSAQEASAEVAPAVESATPARTLATVSVGAREDLTRLSFRFPGGASVTPVRTGARLELRFSKAADIDLSELRGRPPRLVSAVEKVSRPGARLAVALTLQDGVRVRTFNEGGAVVVDLLPGDPSAAAAKPPPPPPPPPPVRSNDPAPRSGLVPVSVEEGRDETRLTLSWAGPARAAAFKRGDFVWLLFDTGAQFDIRGASKTEITPVRGEGVAGLRIAARSGVNLSARMQGNAWVFTLGPRESQGAQAAVRRDVGAAGHGRVVVDFGGEGVVRRIADPVVGDMLDVGLVGGPVRGVVGRRATPDATVFESTHGGAVQLRSDQVAAAWDNGAMVVARKASLQVPVAEAEDLAPLESASFLDLRRDASVPREKVLDRKDELERRAAAEGVEVGARSEARMALARFLVAQELSAEALGALKVAAVNQPQLDVDPRYRLLRAAANTMMGRTRAAKADLDAGALADDPAAALWRGYNAYLERDWAAARKELEHGRPALAEQPPGWRPRFELALAAALLESGELDDAAQAVARALAAGPSPEVSGDARIIEAKIAEIRGDGRAALSAMQTLAKSPQEAIAIRASYEAARIQLALGAADQDSIATLESLQLRWRGDTLELEVVRQLAALYAQRGRCRDALTVLRAASTRRAENPLVRVLRADMSDLFERLYLDGEADKLEPVQALGLFYDFKELTPIGPNGDKMVRNLSARLVALDLLDQAAGLLQHQVEERLEGVGRAQIAADLAVIYLRDRKPEKALTVIEMSRQPNMPSDLLAERRILEAKAYLDLGRTEQAVELLERDRSANAQRVRAEAAWKDRDWPRAAAELKQLLTTRGRAAPLTDEDRRIVLRTAIAFTFSENANGLAALRKDWGPAMAASPDADAFEVVSAGVETNGAELREVARNIARTDLLDRFLRDLRAKMSAPAAPASPAPPRV